MTHSFRDVSMKVTDSSKIGPGEFFFKEIGSRTISQVIMTLSVSHLHEVPVFISSTMSYITWGIWDLLPIILEIISDDTCHEPKDEILHYRARFYTKLSKTIASAIAERPALHSFTPLGPQYSLFDVVETMLEKNHKQVAILTDNSVLLNVITMETVVRFIYINRLRLHPWYFATTVGDLDLGGKSKLCTINSEDPVIEAFKTMRQENVDCIAVVNNLNHVVGCINLGDFLLISKPKRTIADLFLPAFKFIELGMLHSKGVVPPPFSMCAKCSSDTPLGDLVTYAVQNRTFNYFFIEPDNTVSRLVTSKDIVESFLSLELVRLPPKPTVIIPRTIPVFTKLSGFGSPSFR